MSVSMHRLTIPVFVRGFGVLSNLLTKAAAHAEERKVELDSLVGARLAPDMLPLSGQIQRASDTTKGAVGRLTGIDVPSFADDEKTFADLHARIDKTLAFFATTKPEIFEGTETKSVPLKVGKFEVTFTGEDYLLQFVLPNFFFHVTTTHDILRNVGVPVGKLDYLGPFG